MIIWCMVGLMLSTVRMLEIILLIGLSTASFDKNKSGVHDEYPDVYEYAWLVLLLDVMIIVH